MKCENCGNEHDGSYGSGRFCSAKCAKGFSTKNNRKEINKKVSLKLKGRSCISKGSFKKGDNRKRFIFNESAIEKSLKTKTLKREQYLRETLFDDLELAYKRQIILKEQDSKCNNCKANSWLNKSLILELHHKDGNKLNNVRNNLEFLCPNCHSQTKTWRRKKN